MSRAFHRPRSCASMPVLAVILAALAAAAQDMAPAVAQSAASQGTAAAVPSADELAPVALTPAQEELAAEIESGLKCPVCRSQSVATSRSFMAADMSRRVRQMVAEGKSKEEIREYFVARYGDYIVLSPRKEGFAWVVWLLPFALVLGGAATIVGVARHWKGRPPAAAPAPPSSTSTYMQRLERELEETE